MSTSYRIGLGRLSRTLLVSGSLALAVSCVSTEKDTGTEYMVSESKEESFLDSRIEQLTEEAKLYPKRHDLYYKIASVYYEKQSFLDSAAALQKAIDLAPHESKYHFQLGRIYMQMQELELAEEAFRRAVDLSANDRYSGPRAALALVLSMRGKNKEAVEQFLRCVEVEPDNVEYYYSLGAQYDILGNREEAIRYFREYLLRGGRTYRKNTVFILEQLGVDVDDLVPPSPDRGMELGLRPGIGRAEEFEARPTGARLSASRD